MPWFFTLKNQKNEYGISKKVHDFIRNLPVYVKLTTKPHLIGKSIYNKISNTLSERVENKSVRSAFMRRGA